jgi:DNA polymerase elongation subunit (family B)
LKLEGRDAEVDALKRRYEAAIRNRAWPVAMFAKTEQLQDAPATYQAKIGKGGRARSAAYELALAARREYRAGDQVSYYVTGTKKSVAVHDHARLVADWDPAHRDENVAYYLAKLNALCEKFTGSGADQGELGL